MLAGLSPEAKIKNELRELYCAESNFAKISGVVGKTRLAEGLAGQKDFDRHDAERMLEVLQEMRELQTAVGDAPIDWSRVDKVLTALVMRRIAQFENDERMNDIAKSAAQSMVK
jgi:predicted TIM-barrel fold metal-dependent hydrolase